MNSGDLLTGLHLDAVRFSKYMKKYQDYLDSLDDDQRAFYKRTKHGHLEDVAASLTASLGASVTAADLTNLLNQPPGAQMLIAVSCCDNG